MYKTKKMIHMDVRDENGKQVDWYNIEMNKLNNLQEIEEMAIEKIYKVDELVGREHKNLHTELSVMTVRA